MKLFDFFHKYFGFNRRERNGIIILLGIIISLILVRIFLPAGNSDIHLEITKLPKKAENKGIYDRDTPIEQAIANVGPDTISAAPSYFPFNPNTIGPKEAKQLGFSDKLFKTLENYRNKGGKFRDKESLKKLYGMNDALYTKLADYIIVSSKDSVTTNRTEKKPTFSNKFTIIDLNTADSAQIVSLPSIGPAFTKRIIKFRNALGGYYGLEQLKEVYGMKDSTLEIIKSRISFSEESIVKIPVNSAGIEQLKKHPYITFNMASTLVNYRNKHGKLKSIEDLKEIGTFNEEQIQKLKHYISFD